MYSVLRWRGCFKTPELTKLKCVPAERQWMCHRSNSFGFCLFFFSFPLNSYLWLDMNWVQLERPNVIRQNLNLNVMTLFGQKNCIVLMKLISWFTKRYPEVLKFDCWLFWLQFYYAVEKYSRFETKFQVFIGENKTSYSNLVTVQPQM